MTPTANAHQPLNFAIQTTDPSGTLTTLTSSVDATMAYLDQLVQGIQDAINNRDFSPSAPIWSHLSDDYEMGNKSPFGHGSLAKQPATGAEENIHAWSSCCAQYPDYHMVFRSRTTEVEEARGRATTLALLQVTGFPTGILNQGLMLFEWKQVAGSWKLHRTTCYRGPGLY